MALKILKRFLNDGTKKVPLSRVQKVPSSGVQKVLSSRV